LKVSAGNIWAIISTTALITWAGYKLIYETKQDNSELTRQIKVFADSTSKEIKELRIDIRKIYHISLVAAQKDSIMAVQIEKNAMRQARTLLEQDSIKNSIRAIYPIIYNPMFMDNIEKKKLCPVELVQTAQN